MSCYDHIASKGSTYYLLRKWAKIQRHHKPSKLYSIDIAKFRKAKEQNTKEEEDHLG